MQTKELSLTKKRQGYTLTQIIRTDKSAIYSVSFKNAGGRLIEDYAYEVIKIRVSNTPEHWRHRLNFNDFPASAERYPSTEEFGKYAWCYRQKEDALKKFNLLNGQ